MAAASHCYFHTALIRYPVLHSRSPPARALIDVALQAGRNLFPSEQSIRSALPDDVPMDHGKLTFRDKVVTWSAVLATNIPQLLKNNSTVRHAKGELVFHSNQPHDQLQFGVHGDKGGNNTNLSLWPYNVDRTQSVQHGVLLATYTGMGEDYELMACRLRFRCAPIHTRWWSSS